MQYDFTVFGATGLTGRHIVDHVYELAATQPQLLPENLKWAIAGRSEEGLQSVLAKMADKYPSVPPPDILIANVVRRDTLDAMTQKSRVIINAVGPFRFMGEYVVRSCVENGCDYVDVTGEPEFVERMQRTYHSQAVKRNATIVHSCGFDSVPTDIGVLVVKRLYLARGWTPAHVEMFLQIHAGKEGIRGGYATFESAVHGFGSTEVLREIRKASGLAPLPRTGPRLKFHSGATYNKELGMYHVPFKFADPAIVRLSQQLFLTGYGQPPSPTGEPMPPTVQFAAYLLLPKLWVVIVYYIFGAIFSFLAASPWGRNLLLKHPERFTLGIFSKEDPTDAQLAETSFEVILKAKGYDSNVVVDGPPTEKMTVVVRGPEMGYIATPRIVVQCALSLLRHKTKGTVPYGVLTPSVAFWNTDLVEKLDLVGIHIEHDQTDATLQQE